MSEHEHHEAIEKEKEECCCHEEHEHEHHHDHDHEHEHHHDHDHDHEHEHHHHHDHDHDHEHHHHHHDDDECGCEEHEHHHHHHHDDDCDCGCHDHDHEHDEGTSYDIPGYAVFETHSHEGATICSFEKDILTDVEKAKVAMEDSINELSAWLDSTGALIGHVKGYIREAGPTTTFSTTGGTLNVEGHEAQGAAIGFASIVFGPTEEELKDKVVEVFERL